MKAVHEHRAFYAEFVVRSAGLSDARLIDAFAAIPREDYLGPGPWPIYVGPGYLMSPGRDPRLLYSDVLVGIVPERGINNGQPGLHALCMGACAMAPGERVLHIGAGTGYYTAILATLVGPKGCVIAYEIDAGLARRAERNLAHFSTVTVRAASATTGVLPRADVIYVNAGATHPLPQWLDALRPAGRLVFPLTPNEGLGCVLMVTRLGDLAYGARILTRAGFIPCAGARDDADSLAVRHALETSSPFEVRSLHRGSRPDATAWCVGSGWWLSTAPPVPNA